MSSFVYTPTKNRAITGALDLGTGADVRVLLVMSNTTADTDEDAEFVGDIGTLDEYDGSGYVRKAVGGEVVNEDDANDRAEADHSDVTWTALGAGTRQAVGLVYYQFVTDDTDSPLLAYVDTGGFPFAGNGGDVVLEVNPDGYLQAI